MRNESASSTRSRPKSAISGVFFDAPLKRRQLAELDKKLVEPGFWNDPANSQKIEGNVIEGEIKEKSKSA